MTTYERMDDPTDGQIHPVRAGLHLYNRQQLGGEVNDPYARLLIYARDDAGDLIGGVYGEAYWGWLHVDTLWVSESHRGQDIGSGLLPQQSRRNDRFSGARVLSKAWLRGVWHAGEQAARPHVVLLEEGAGCIAGVWYHVARERRKRLERFRRYNVHGPIAQRLEQSA